MILKVNTVKTVKHAGGLARHLLKPENEQINIAEFEGVATPYLEKGFKDMQRMTGLTKGKTGLLHIAVNPREGEELSADKWARAIDEIESEFKLKGQPHAHIFHIKDGKEHLHVVYQLTDVEREKLIDTWQSKKRCHRIARTLEKEFSHQITPSSKTDLSYDKPAHEATKRRQEKDPRQRKKAILNAWQKAKSPQEFKALVEKEGYQIAKGERAALILVNAKTKETVSNLARDIKGVKTREVKDKLKSLDIPQAKELQQRAKDTELRIVEMKETSLDIKETAIMSDMRTAGKEISETQRRVDKLRQMREDKKEVTKDKPNTAAERIKRLRELREQKRDLGRDDDLSL